MKAITYILKCSDESYYVGSTTDMERRLQEHNTGRGCDYTKARRPVEVVYTEEHDSEESAYLRERQLHGWSRKKKELLINGIYKKQ